MTTSSRLQVTVHDLGLIDYQKAYDFQEQCLQKVLSERNQSLLFCEHPPVLTLGRLSSPKNLLFSNEELQQRKVSVFNINRGGDVTLHAPGQLVVYPILNLKEQGRDLHQYIRRLEDLGIAILSDFDIVARREPRQTGLWVKQDKIMSIGIGVKKWVSLHGLALNVNTDLNYFSLIRPCGLDVKMTSIQKVLHKVIPLAEVKRSVLRHFHTFFQVEIVNDQEIGVQQ